MTVQLNIDDKQWAEAQLLAKELDVDCNEMVINAFRSSLYSLKNAKEKALTIADKERRHRESYEKFPVGPDEFLVEEEQLIEAWKDL